MSVKYELKDLDVSKLPKAVRDQLDKDPDVERRTPYYSIWWPKTSDNPTYFEGLGKYQQVFWLDFISLNEDGTAERHPFYETDENGNPYKTGDDHIAKRFILLLADPSEITYPLKDYFESIKCEALK